MSMLTAEDERFVERQRRAASGAWILGWVLILLPIGSTPYLWGRLDAIQGIFRQAVAREQAAVRNPRVTPGEARLLEQLVQQDEQVGRLVHLVFLAIFGAALGGLMIQGMSLVLSSKQQKRWLNIVDRLEQAAGARSGA